MNMTCELQGIKIVTNKTFLQLNKYKHYKIITVPNKKIF